MVPPLGVVKEKVTVLVVLVRRHCAVGVALRRAVDDEVPGAVKEETGPAAVRRVPPGPQYEYTPVTISADAGSEKRSWGWRVEVRRQTTARI